MTSTEPSSGSSSEDSSPDQTAVGHSPPPDLPPGGSNGEPPPADTPDMARGESAGGDQSVGRGSGDNSAGQRKFDRVSLLRGLAGVGFLVVAMMFVSVMVATKPTAAGKEGDQELPRVQVIRVDEIQQPRQWQGFGSVRALDEADVPSRLIGVVLNRRVQPGARVKRTTKLVELDASDFKQQLEAANSTVQELSAQAALLKVEEKWLSVAEKLHRDNVMLVGEEVKRYEGLARLDASSAQDLDNARGRRVRAELEWNAIKERVQQLPSRVAQNKAKMDAALATQKLRQLDVDRCLISSPLDGVIQAVDVHAGEPVQPGQRVARVVSLKRVEVALHLPAAARAEIGIDDPIQVSLSNNPRKSWTAKIVRISPEDDLQARTMEVYTEIMQSDQTGYLLVPGVFVRGVVTGRVAHQRMILPRRAVRDNRTRVVRDQRVISVPVEADFTVSRGRPDTGLMDDQWVVLAAGEARLKPGDVVVLNYSAKVRDGQRVQAVEAKLQSTDPGP